MNLYETQAGLTQTFVANIGIDAAYENRQYTPTSGTPYAELYFLPSDTNVSTVGPNGSNKNIGILQITLNYPIDNGHKDIRQKADSILSNEFAIGTLHTYNTTTTRVYKTVAEQAQNRDGWHKLPLSIYWENYEVR